MERLKKTGEGQKKGEGNDVNGEKYVCERFTPFFLKEPVCIEYKTQSCVRLFLILFASFTVLNIGRFPDQISNMNFNEEKENPPASSHVYASEDDFDDEGREPGRNQEKVDMNIAEALEYLEKMKRQKSNWDPNLPDEVEKELDDAFGTQDVFERFHVAEELLQDSPYPEVRAAVLNFDDGTYASTVRAWFLGMLFNTIGSAVNMLFSMRAPSIGIGSFVAQLVVYPIGCAWARWLPTCKCRFWKYEICLNPGPFSKKEHALIIIMANASWGAGAAYATDILLAQKAFYHQNFGWGFDMMLTISNMMLGFGFAGFFNRFLVQPAAMIWPATLICTTLFTALHDRPAPDPTKTSGWKIDKFRFFIYCMIGSFVWYWIPGYIAPFLSIFAIVTWAKPHNVIINQLFGGQTGLSLLPLTFDWTQVTGYLGSPLMCPWHAIANTLIGTITFFWFVAIGLHYSNFRWSQYLPMSDSGSYDNTGKTYNVSRILDPATLLFDEQRYQSYSPLFLSTTFSLTYGLQFAAMISLVVHTALFHGKDIWIRFKNFNEVEEDIHAKLLAKYKPVPFWWYLIVLAIMFAMGMVVSVCYETHLAWWAFMLSLVIGFIFFLPIGIIAATTNIGIGLNVLTEFIIGYIQPGKPMAMMMFKAYGFMSMSKGLGFAGDMKLGMYMKVPPRVSFLGQMIAAIWCAVVQVGVLNWALGAVDNICHPQQKDHFTCPGGKVFFNASIIWGAIGPKRIFSPGATYSHMLYFFIPGAILPILIFLAVKRWPNSPVRFLSAPIIFSGSGAIPPATPLNYLTWGLVGFIFQKVIRNRHRGWWMHYNYILSAGLDIGLSFCTILIFCSLQLTKTEFPSYWGNIMNTMDLTDTAIREHVAPGQRFGPDKWF